MGLHELTGELEGIISDFDFVETMKFKKEDDEKRNHPRIESRQIVLVEQNGTRIEGLTLDISLSGVKIQLNNPLEDIDGTVTLSMYMPSDSLKHFEQQDPIYLSASIQWYREEQGKHHYGFEYAYIKEEDREKTGRRYVVSSNIIRRKPSIADRI